MATAEIKFRTTSGNRSSHRHTYLVTEATDELDALDAVALVAPTVYDNLNIVDFDYEEVRYPDVWEITAIYAQASPQLLIETGSAEYSFDIAVESQRILQAYSTVNSYVVSGVATDYHEAIGIDPATKQAEGADVLVPISSFQVTYAPANAVVTTVYQKTVRTLVGKVNNGAFNDHAAGEVLFVGASGRKRTDADWELSFRFDVRPNQTGLVIGDITGINCNGWDLIDPIYERAVDNNRYIQKPVQVDIKRVYQYADFSVLGLP
jgi:hypothetical protein